MHNTKDKLPEDRSYVLAYFPDQPWRDPDCNDQKYKWEVVKFVRGLSEEERDKLPDQHPRKNSYHLGDVWGNNRVPHEWHSFGPSRFFGQECSVWCELPSKEEIEYEG